MPQGNWIESQRETVLNDKGEVISTKVTEVTKPKKDKVFHPKDILDLILRTIGIAAIVTPIWLFYSQQHADLAKQKNSLKFEAYSSVAVELHTYREKLIMYSQTPDSNEGRRNKLIFQLIPKAILFNDTLVNACLNKLTDVVSIYNSYVQVYYDFDQAYLFCTKKEAVFLFRELIHNSREFNCKTFQFFLDTAFRRYANFIGDIENCQTNLGKFFLHSALGGERDLFPGSNFAYFSQRFLCKSKYFNDTSSRESELQPILRAERTNNLFFYIIDSTYTANLNHFDSAIIRSVSYFH